MKEKLAEQHKITAINAMSHQMKKLPGTKTSFFVIYKIIISLPILNLALQKAIQETKDYTNAEIQLMVAMQNSFSVFLTRSIRAPSFGFIMKVILLVLKIKNLDVKFWAPFKPASVLEIRLLLDSMEFYTIQRTIIIL